MTETEYLASCDPDVDPEGAFDPSEHGVDPQKARIRSHFEHGQWWITDNDTGAQWSVVDCQTETGDDYYGFEQVTQGDDE